MTVLDPKQLKKQAIAAQEEARAAARHDALMEARARRKRIKALAEGRFEGYLPRIESAIQAAAQRGSLEVKFELGTFHCYELNEGRESERALALKPVWDKLAEHFKARGFETRVEVVGSTEWYRGEPGPGDDTAYLRVIWG